MGENVVVRRRGGCGVADASSKGGGEDGGKLHLVAEGGKRKEKFRGVGKVGAAGEELVSTALQIEDPARR